MPEVLEELSRRTCEPNPVKESVQWTFSEFKKTHQDAWQETRAAFTSEQWENISIGMELAPSYIVLNTFSLSLAPKIATNRASCFQGGLPTIVSDHFKPRSRPFRCARVFAERRTREEDRNPRRRRRRRSVSGQPRRPRANPPAASRASEASTHAVSSV